MGSCRVNGLILRIIDVLCLIAEGRRLGDDVDIWGLGFSQVSIPACSLDSVLVCILLAIN